MKDNRKLRMEKPTSNGGYSEHFIYLCFIHEIEMI